MADFRARIEAFADLSRATGDLNSFINQSRRINVEVNLQLNQASQALHNLLQQMQQQGGTAGTQFSTQFVNAVNSGLQNINASQTFNNIERQTNRLTVNIRDSMRNSLNNAFNANTARTFGNQMEAWIRNNMRSVNAVMRQETQNMFNVRTYGDAFNVLMNDLNIAINNADSGAVQRIREQFRLLQSEVRATGNAGRTFGQQFSSALGSVAKFATSYISIYRIFNALRDGVKTVVELDTALVDLQKTSTASTSQLNSFYREANDIAKQYGTSTKQIIQGAADWSRLGYNLEDSKAMSKLSSQFAAISPGMSVDQATTGLVSTMKAFGIEADDVLDGVMSKVNAVGNGFALTNADIMNALQNSSAAMAVANNSLDETIALITAGTEIVQDASKVGNGLRTISMRIRGMNEETEELDDELVNIKGDVYELTNGKVSIMEDADTYKSTYQVLKEISEVWDDLTDKNQAQLLDKLFGKTRAQIGASIISNFSQAEAAMETMGSSAGAADKEMDIITNSLEYKINALKETFTGIWQNIFNREDLGNVISFIQPVLNALDSLTEKFGLFGTLLIGGTLTGAIKSIVVEAGGLAKLNFATFFTAFGTALPNVTALGKAIGNLFLSIANGTGIVNSIKGVLASLWQLIAAHPFVALAAAIGVAYAAFNYFNGTVERAYQKMESAVSEYETSTKKVEELNTQLKTTEEKIAALEQKGGLTFIEQSQLEDLREAAELLQLEADIEKKKNEGKAKEVAKTTEQAVRNSFLHWGEVSDEAVDQTYDSIKYQPTRAYMAGESFGGYQMETNIVAGLAELRRLREEKKQASIEHAAAQTADELESTWQVYKEYDEGIRNTEALLQSQLEPLLEYKRNFENVGIDSLEQSQLEAYNAVNDAIRMIYEAIDPNGWKQMKYDEFLNANSALKELRSYLISYANERGNLLMTADTIREAIGDEKYSLFEGIFDGIDEFTADDFINDINSRTGVKDVNKVAQGIIDGLQESADEASEEKISLTPEAEADVEVKTTISNSAEEREKLEGTVQDWLAAGKDEYVLALDSLMNNSDLSSGFNADDYIKAVEDIVNGTYEAEESTLDLTGTIQDLNLIFSETSSVGINKAISDYKSQMSSLSEARKKWDAGELTIEDMTDLQRQFVELNEFDMSNFGSGLEQAMSRITGSVEEVDNSIKDFKENVIDTDDKLSKSFRNISNLSKQSFKDALSEDKTPQTEKYAKDVNNIMSAASEAGLVNLESAESVDAFIDSIYESGIMIGKNGAIVQKGTGIMGAFGDAIKAVGGEETIAGKALIVMRDNILGLFGATEETKSAYDSLKETLDTFTTYQTDVSSALKASRSGVGLTTEEVKKLTTSYEKLDSFDASALFEKTANGIHINEEEFKRLNQEVQKSTLLQMYSDLGLKLDELHAAQESGSDTSALEKDIADAQMLIAQYEGLTSAYYAWQNAQSGGNERDSFESVAKGYDNMEKVLNQGWYGDESLNSYLDLMLNAHERTGDAVADFEKLSQTIEGTGHSLKDYFTFENGDLVTDGLYDFLDDVNTVLGEDFAKVTKDANGNDIYSFDFSGDKLQQVADAFGTTTEFVQLMERAMIDAGFAIEMNSSELDTLKESLKGLQESDNEKIKISSDIDIDGIDFATASVDELFQLSEELSNEKIRLEAEFDGSEEMQAAIDSLDRSINAVNSKAIKKSIQLQIDGGSSIDELLAIEDDSVLAATLQIDVSQAEEAREILQNMANATETATLTVTIDESQFAALTSSDKEATVTYKAVTDEPESYEPTDKEATVKYGIDPSIPSSYTPNNKSATVTYYANTSNLPSSFPSITRYVNYVKTGNVGTTSAYGTLGGGYALGTAHKSGSAYNAPINWKHAYSNGNIALSNDEYALVNELGTESIIRDGKWMLIPGGMHQQFLKKGDIVLSARQTKSLLATGVAPGRGRAYAYGSLLMNAYDSGSGGRRRKTTSTSSSSSSSSSRSYSSSGGSSGYSYSNDDDDDYSSSTSISSDTDADYMDWIEIKIDRIERKIASLKKSADDAYNSWINRNRDLSEEISKTTEEIEIQEKAYDRYIQQANSVGLDESIARLVREGTIDIAAYDSDSEVKKQIDLYQQWYEKACDCKDAIDDLTVSLADLFEQEFDLIITKWANALQNLTHAINREEEIISRRSDFGSEYVWQHVPREMSEANIDSYRILVDDTINQRKNLTDELKELYTKLESGVENGTIEKESEGYYALLEQIQDIESEIDDANAKIISYSNSISEEYKNVFDSLANDYENKLSLAEHLSNEYNNYLELAEAKGLQTSRIYFLKLRAIEERNAAAASQEAKTLQEQLNKAIASGEIQRSSQAWYDMTERINEAVEAEQEAIIAAQEYTNQIRQISWDKFDYLQEKIKAITEESEFLINLFSDDELFGENGTITSAGMATAGLHAMNYNVEMNSADRYAKEIKEINKDIANDPSNIELIKHKEELIKAQRDSIAAAENEKKAIKSLISDGIKKELSYMKDLISKYNDALKSQKDLYDYQKKVKEQTSEISSLQKQLSAYSNDMSEETRAKIQKIRVELDKKQEELQETEYERMVSDTKKLLDDFYDEYEKAVNERLDNVDLLLKQVIESSNDNASVISKVISDKADSVGFELSEAIGTIWDNDSVGTVMSMYTHNYTSELTSINSTIYDINRAVNNLWNIADEEAKRNINAVESESASKTNSEVASVEASKGKGTLNEARRATTTTTTTTTTKKKNIPVTTTNATITPTTVSLDEETKKHVAAAIWAGGYGWGTGDDRISRLLEVFGENNGIQSIVNKGYGYIDNYDPTGYSYLDMRMKFKGYKKGAKHVGHTGYVWTHEGQNETYLRASDHAVLTRVGADDRIYNAMASENLWQAANNPGRFIVNGIAKLIGNTYASQLSGKIEQHFDNITFSMPNVKNYNELITQMQQDSKFEKLIQAMTVGQLNGKAPESKFHFTFN